MKKAFCENRVELTEKLFVGKTIQRVDSLASNTWYFHMTDGSIIIIDSGSEPEGWTGELQCRIAK